LLRLIFHPGVKKRHDLLVTLKFYIFQKILNINSLHELIVLGIEIAQSQIKEEILNDT